MSNCDKFKENFSSYIEGELTPDTRSQLESHLSVCPQCKEAVYRFRLIQNSLQQLPQIKTSPDFENSLHHRLQYPSNHHGAWFPIRNFDWKIPAFGTVLVLIFVGYFMMTSPESSDVNANPPHKSSFSPNISNQSSQQVTQHPEQKSTAGAENQALQDSMGEDSQKNLDKNIKYVNDKIEDH